MKLKGAIEEYVAWRKAQDFAANTVKNDRSSLNYLLSTLGNIELDNITYARMTEVFGRMQTSRAASSVNAAHATYSAFFMWCRQVGQYMLPDHNPLLGIRYRKVHKKQRRRLAVHEFGDFLDAAPEPRARALAAVGLYLMLRESEIRTLRVGDLDIETGYLRVTIHKTKDEDEMPLSSKAADELLRWMRSYEDEIRQPLRPDMYLIPAKAQGGGDLSPYTPMSRPADVLATVLNSYGWSEHKGDKVHMLRRSGARATYDALAEMGIDNALEATAALLHHASVTMTERYIGLAGSRAKRDKLIRGADLFGDRHPANVVPLRRIS